LKGPATKWFSKIKEDSIYEFDQLAKLFMTAFASKKAFVRNPTYLLNIRQQDKEFALDFIKRLFDEALTVEDTDEKLLITAFMAGLRK
ncbi:UNVERIFIED_CONTAM: hypothetical protein ITH96_25265, partial [Salmonella enterica subsp. enterica serovar Weltevreden]